ncbi:hypothetical protein [Pyrococcus kukulkanii]|uniref:hypothetical protein n=1 Tax=Pyrococcus kukulkanii TaxID=1609559 RepID=UPI0035684731
MKTRNGVFDYIGKIVIDISGFIGDTAVYFAVNGAKKVYAYELHPSTFELLRENIKRNTSQDIITVENIGAVVRPLKPKFSLSSTYLGLSAKSQTL